MLILILSCCLVSSVYAGYRLDPAAEHGLVLVPAEMAAEGESGLPAFEHLRSRSKRSMRSDSYEDENDFDDEDDDDDDDKRQRKYHRLAHAVHVQSDVRYRYATTLVTSEVLNPEPEAREVFLTVILPDTAFISRFAIEVDGQIFVAYVREKTEAWKEYQSAVAQGKTAGHVGISARHSNHFRVSVNTESRTKVIFYLLYEELLQRRAGIYEHIINITPRQKLKDFGIEVNVIEQRNLTYLHVPALKRHEISVPEAAMTSLKGVRVKKVGSVAFIRYRPNLQDLEHRLRSRHALQFVVEYDVERPEKGGEIQVVDGYFVHFVAPENLPQIPKHVVFVLDTSGSMIGKKIHQTKAAMRTILGEMKVDRDYLTIISFSDNITTWLLEDNKMVVKATADNLRAAMHYVDITGGTNLNDVLVHALTVATHVEKRADVLEGVQPMIFFLTDGHATSGETDNDKILSNVRMANLGSVAPVFSLAFGRQADFSMLKILSLQNNAFARKIYVAADASLQLEGFYKEVSSPTLQDVKFKYEDDEILSNTLTATNFHLFYEGSEMVVAGKLPKDYDKKIREKAHEIIHYQILATQAYGTEYKVDGQYTGSETITETLIDVPHVRAGSINFLERLWAYLTIQDLLKRVAKGDLNSCNNNQGSLDIQSRPKRSIVTDDEDYDNDYYEASGDYEDDNKVVEGIKDVMEEIGDADIVICDNLERALFLSLKYEFVTPLTSLVVVKPDNNQEPGDFGDIDKPANIVVMSASPTYDHQTMFTVTLAFISSFFFNCLYY